MNNLKGNSKTFDLINSILLDYETGKRKNKDVTVHELIGLKEEKGIVFGGLECEFDNYCYLIHFEIGNRWLYPDNNDIEQIENELFNIIDDEVKKHFKK